VPSTVILGTHVFETFIERNGLEEYGHRREADDRIAHAFQGGNIPHEHLGDLMSIVQQTAGNPLAVRSSSLMEDSLHHPFAGVFETKMIPNNQPDAGARFRRLAEAIRLVYASTYFGSSRHYFAAIGGDPSNERMAVLIQEIVGRKFGRRFYPEVSGVCRSYNYYRTADTQPQDGVVSLALGLGKTIVDGGVSWSYSPSRPHAGPPYASVDDLLKHSQLHFWAVNLGTPPVYDPTRETEYLLHAELKDADYDDALKYVASTYDASMGRLVDGVARTGPRVVNFAPLLKLEQWPLNKVLMYVMDLFEQELGHAVEIEFALTFPSQSDGPARLVILQVRPMLVAERVVDLPSSIKDDPGLLVFSDHVMGNGSFAGLCDIIYVRPETFDVRLTREVAAELEVFNARMIDEKRRYVLIGFGRWGSSEPWLGIPVNWGQISQAAVIVEATLPEMNVEPSQGSHFFHNIESFQISYFSVHHSMDPAIDWDWLQLQETIDETSLVRHVRTERPLTIEVDGRIGRGAIRHHLDAHLRNNTNQRA
jgi:hypothetical protein